MKLNRVAGKSLIGLALVGAPFGKSISVTLQQFEASNVDIWVSWCHKVLDRQNGKA